jgi:signal transduction histidine kinase
MWTEAQFAKARDEAERLELLWEDKKAENTLVGALQQARAAGQMGYELFFDGWLAHLQGEDERALRLLADALDKGHGLPPFDLPFLRVVHRAMAGVRRKESESRIRLEAWRKLSARAAHRIDNQLFVSQGALRTLKDVHDPKVAEAVADLEASRGTIHRIIREFQRFSKNEPPVLAPTKLGSLVNDTVRRVAQMVSQVQVSAEVEEPLPACPLDARQFGEALGELLENALHHTPPGGQIRVTASAAPSPDGPRVRVAVEDTGSGVAAADKERVFEPFFSRRPGGTGLGLAIVKQIIENHRGTIRETGQVGSGARFEIELPAHVEEETAHENPGN